MTFNPSLFNSVLILIEENLTFTEDDISDVYGWDLDLEVKVKDIFDSHPENRKDEIKYIIKVLYIMGYIQFAPNHHSVISSVTEKGYRFIFSYLHNIEFH